MPFRTRNTVEPLVKVTDGFQLGNLKYFKTYDLKTKIITFTDWPTEGYHDIIKNGGIVNTQCSYSYYELKAPKDPGSGSFRGAPFTGESITDHYSGGYPKGVTLTVPNDVTKADVAKHKALAGVDGAPYEAIEDIGELKETLAFLKSPLQALHDASDEFNKLAWIEAHKRAIPIARALAGLWLTWRFVITPLYRSVDSILEQLGTDIVRLSRENSHGYAKLNDTRLVETAQGIIDWQCHVTDTLEYHASILYEVKNPVGDWRYQYGLRWKDVPKGLWQLMPLSFLIDRMVSISGFLGGLSAMMDPDVTILAGSVTYRAKRVCKTRLIAIHSPLVQDLVGNESEAEKFAYVRDRWTPSFSDTFPPLHLGGLVDSLTKATDVIAIIVSNLSGRKR